MLNLIYRLPDILALALIVGLMVGSAMLASVVGARLINLKDDEARDTAA